MVALFSDYYVKVLLKITNSVCNTNRKDLVLCHNNGLFYLLTSKTGFKKLNLRYFYGL